MCVVFSVIGICVYLVCLWLGDNVIYKLGVVLDWLVVYWVCSVDIDGCIYWEGFLVVCVVGGVVGNVIFDVVLVMINYCFVFDWLVVVVL